MRDALGGLTPVVTIQFLIRQCFMSPTSDIKFSERSLLEGDRMQGEGSRGAPGAGAPPYQSNLVHTLAVT